MAGKKEDKGTEQFDPATLTPEAREYIRRTVQSESDVKTAAAERRLKAAAEGTRQSAAQEQENTELLRMAEEEDFESLGRRVAGQLARRSVRNEALTEAATVIEQDMVDKFTESLGETTVEQIRTEVAEAGGAHAEFAQALAAASVEKARGGDIEAEVEAVLVKKGLVKRDELGGADEVGAGSGGGKYETFAEIEAAYGRGDVSDAVYEEALKNR